MGVHYGGVHRRSNAAIPFYAQTNHPLRPVLWSQTPTDSRPALLNSVLVLASGIGMGCRPPQFLTTENRSGSGPTVSGRCEWQPAVPPSPLLSETLRA